MPRGQNLKGPDGAKGRAMGASLGGQALSQKAAPTDCIHCQHLGYTSWMQHIGHLGFRAVMVDNPAALHSLADKITQTGRAASRQRWKDLARG